MERWASIDHEPIHCWFSLSYANYLVLPRAVLQSMPEAWQRKFVECLEDLENTPFDWEAPRYRVSTVDENGRFCRNTDPHYNRGRTVVARRVLEAGDT